MFLKYKFFHTGLVFAKKMFYSKLPDLYSKDSSTASLPNYTNEIIKETNLQTYTTYTWLQANNMYRRNGSPPHPTHQMVVSKK